MLIFPTKPSGARVLTLAVLLSAGFSASAQTSVDSTPPAVVVTAARVAQLQTDALPHTTIITSDDIRNSQADDLLSLLRHEAGIEFSQNGGPGQMTSLFMRGARPNETLILVDGVPVRRQGLSAAPALEQILPEQIDHIEIVRGNVSAIYGSGAIGGVVQIFTKQGGGKPALNGSIEAGSRGTLKVTGGVSGKADDTRYALSVTHFKTDGFSANNTTQYPNENPDKDGDRNSSFSANVSHEWSKGNEFGLRAYANDGKTSFDGDGFGAPTDINTGRSKQQSLALFSRNNFSQDWTSNVTLSQTATRTRNTSIATNGYDVSDAGDTSFLQWTNEISLAPDWTVNAGVDAAREKIDTFADYGFGASTADYARSTSSVFAGLNGKRDAHHIQVNLRHDSVEGTGSDTTGYLGYGFALTPSVKLVASTSTAFNAPTLVQFFDPLYGNRNLKAERSQSHELGVQYAADTSLLRATWFDTKTRDQLGYDPTTYQTINVDRASNRGLELSASGRLAETDLHASLTLQDPKDDTTNQRLIRRAKTLGSVSASRAFGAWRVGGDLQYTGERPDNGRTLDAYWLANLNARYAITRQLSLFGRIDNLFNRDYQTVYGFNQPPRGVFAGLSWQQ
ncbi:MAG TPA: TonB-dependent receptor [Oxalobacteraceae bacterium]|nr:TonB-dependent receptor [Oxalobacteraceae bacterium]